MELFTAHLLQKIQDFIIYRSRDIDKINNVAHPDDDQKNFKNSTCQCCYSFSSIVQPIDLKLCSYLVLSMYNNVPKFQRVCFYYKRQRCIFKKLQNFWNTLYIYMLLRHLISVIIIISFFSIYIFIIFSSFSFIIIIDIVTSYVYLY